MSIPADVWPRIEEMMTSIPESGPFTQRAVEFRREIDRYPAIVNIILKTYVTSNQENERTLEIRVFQPDRQQAAFVTIYNGTKQAIERSLANRQNADKLICSSVRACVRGLRYGRTGEWPFIEPFMHFWAARGVPGQHNLNM